MSNTFKSFLDDQMRDPEFAEAYNELETVVMPDIRYDYKELKKGWYYEVKLDKCVVGRIKPVSGGFQYFPTGDSEGGEVFSTLSACQRSLENTA